MIRHWQKQSLLVIAMITALMICQTGTQAQDAAGDAMAAGKAALDNGMRYLRKTAGENGTWGEGPIRPGYTSLAASALLRGGAKYGEDALVTQAVDWLLSLQKEDGGFYETDYPNYHTSVIIMTLCDADAVKFKPQVDKAAMFIKGLQFKEGCKDPADVGGIGYGSDKTRSDLSNTQLALDALKAAGVPESDPVYQEALKFVTRCQNSSETNTDQEWAGEDGGFVYRPANTKVVDGEWTDAAGMKRYKSYGSMTYAGVKSLIYCNASKDDARVQQAWKWIEANYTLTENPAMGATGLYYYYHTFAKAMHVMGAGDIKTADGQSHDWRADLCRQLASLQKDDGSWINDQDEKWMEGNSILATSYALLALSWATN